MTQRKGIADQSRTLVRSFHSADGGAIAVVAAVLITVLATVVGMVVDITAMYRLKTQAEASADAAALAGVSAAAIDRNTTPERQRALSIAAAQRVWTAKMSADGVPLNSVKIDATTETNSATKVTVDWRINAEPYFAKILGVKSIPIAGQAESRSSPLFFVDIVAIVDASGSMGIGASTQDQEAMQVGMNCVFGCHVHGTDATARSFTTSKGKPVKLRFDVVREALQSIMSSAQSIRLRDDQYRFAVYKFSNRVTEVLAPTTKLPSAINTVGKMELDGEYASGTNFKVAIEHVTSRLALSPGDGTSPDRRRVFYILMTDGIADQVDWRSSADGYIADPAFVPFPPMTNHDGGLMMQGLDPRLCRNFPDGASVMTLNTEYVIPTKPDARFENIASILKPLIARNMQDCATSKDYVFNASSEEAIKSAVHTMFGSIVAMARLTR